MLFLSNFLNRIDKKGRISVPATFRAALAQQEFQGIVVSASLINPCVEACGMDRMEKLYRQMESLDPFSDARDALATTLFGQSMQLAFDGEGRVGLPESLIEVADLKDEAMFVGKGETFEIWQPKAFAIYAEKSRMIAFDQRHQLRAPRKEGQ